MTVTRGKLLYVIVARSEATNSVEGADESTMKSIYKFSSPLFIPKSCIVMNTMQLLLELHWNQRKILIDISSY